MAEVAWREAPTTGLVAGSKALEYACFGPPPDRAPTIVMLHEGLGCRALWRDFPARLAAQTGWGCCVYSRAGYGQSEPTELPRPLDYMTREALEALPDVLAATGFRRGILLGHSDGATIAAIYAGSVQDHRVRGLILMAPHFFAEELGLTEIGKAGKAYESGDLRAGLARYHRDPDNAFRGWHDSWRHLDFRAWNVADVIDYLRVPVLAIQGRQDQYGTLAQIEELENRCYAPVEVAILEQCRHAPHLDQPDATLGEVADFVARLERIEAEEVVITQQGGA